MNSLNSNGDNMTSSPILVLGATGKTGRRIAQRLAAAGVPVRAGSRSATPAFEWFDSSTWPAVLDGVKTAYVCFYPDLAIPEAPGILEAFTRAAKDAGIERLVLLSGRGEAGAVRCENIVVASGIPSVRLRASWFSQNFSEGPLLAGVLGGQIVLPAGNAREPFVDVDDIADVAVAALTDARHDGALYELTGPRMLTMAEAASEIAEAARRPVNYVPVTPEAFVETFTPIVGASIAEFTAELCREVFDGRNESLADGVERALGRGPRDFRDYCRAAARSGVWSA